MQPTTHISLFKQIHVRALRASDARSLQRSSTTPTLLAIVHDPRCANCEQTLFLLMARDRRSHSVLDAAPAVLHDARTHTLALVADCHERRLLSSEMQCAVSCARQMRYNHASPPNSVQSGLLMLGETVLEHGDGLWRAVSQLKFSDSIIRSANPRMCPHQHLCRGCWLCEFEKVLSNTQ